MRICLISRKYPPETGWGGIGAYTYQPAQALLEAGHDVEVISICKKHSTVDGAPPGDVNDPSSIREHRAACGLYEHRARHFATHFHLNIKRESDVKIRNRSIQYIYLLKAVLQQPINKMSSGSIVKRKSTVLALMIVATCSIGFAGQALAGKQGSNTSEQELQAYLYNLYQQQQQQQPAPRQETPPPPPPPPPR
ncbi:MAG: hypothetical protein WC028_06640 [Candidatus Obscuribacterales bacterium]